MYCILMITHNQNSVTWAWIKQRVVINMHKTFNNDIGLHRNVADINIITKSIINRHHYKSLSISFITKAMTPSLLYFLFNKI